VSKRTTITDEILQQCKELASTGLTNKQIALAINISAITLSKNRKLVKSIQDGKLELAKTITKSILANLDENQDRLFIAKRLNLFSPQINIKKATTAKEALENLSTAIKQFGDGEINESQLRTLEATTNSFIKGFEVLEIEERLKKLEEVLEDEDHKK